MTKNEFISLCNQITEPLERIREALKESCIEEPQLIAIGADGYLRFAIDDFTLSRLNTASHTVVSEETVIAEGKQE